ncbi:protein of unknown function [Pseudomonas inefficax]|jgi:hypothetical protein|uniref:Uncharacterized protein n=1 Tax=Pseudomonas inefficax TaxID=2078786 RepID=A0AAQ1P3M4_9PSED|nr:protein of unknown function [Pseudomonas inefficax]
MCRNPSRLTYAKAAKSLNLLGYRGVRYVQKNVHSICGLESWLGSLSKTIKLQRTCNSCGLKQSG